MHRLKLFDKYTQLKRISKGDALLFAMPKKNEFFWNYWLIFWKQHWYTQMIYCISPKNLNLKYLLLMLNYQEKISFFMVLTIKNKNFKKIANWIWKSLQN